jgi:hypothetical protein
VPNHEYQLSINSQRFQKFTNPAGEPAVPYPIRFRTSAGGDAMQPPAKPNPATLAVNGTAIDRLIDSLTQNYSHRERLGLDWKTLVNERRDALAASANAREFASRAATLLARAEDKHIWFDVAGEHVPTYVRPSTPNANLRTLSTLVPEWRRVNDQVNVGRWPDGIGYLAIHSWDRQQATDLLAAFEALWEMHDAPALIVDVRLNGGGDESIARAVAGCFLEQPAIYARRDRIDPQRPGQFTPPYNSVVEPSKQRPRYRGRVAVLIGPAVISSCESFVLMMKQVPGAVLVGSATQGSSGNPQPYDLGNGVTAFLPSWREMTPEGVPLEGRGILPDVDVKTTTRDLQETDPVIDAALAHLRR